MPVIVGVGQVNHADPPAPEPVALMAEAVRRAAGDAGAPGLLRSIDSIRVVNMLSRHYPDPGALVAGLLGTTVRQTVVTTIGGNSPQLLLNLTAEDIAAGRLDVAVIGGAESWRTRAWYKRQGQPPPWTVQDPGAVPGRVVGDELYLATPGELELGLAAPVHFYPMIETALLLASAATGTTPRQHLERAAGLWARMSEVAATNPYAALRTPLTAAEILTPQPANRMVGWPYPKRMNSNSSVDQSAALLVCSAAAATAAGVPRDRWVFLHGGAHASDPGAVPTRRRLDASPAIRAVGRHTLALAGVGIDDLDLVDLYSCFPSAVQVGAAELGLGLERPLSVTGGLTFAGGPWNNYVTHSVATMVGRLRDQPDAWGLCTANGGNLTKHAAGVYAAHPPGVPPGFAHPQDEVDAERTVAVEASGWQGTATLEAWTVLHDGDGRPEVAFCYGRTRAGTRAVGSSRDGDLLALLVSGEVAEPLAIRFTPGGVAAA